MFCSDFLGAVKMAKGCVIKIPQDRNIHIINTAHAQQL